MDKNSIKQERAMLKLHILMTSLIARNAVLEFIEPHITGGTARITITAKEAITAQRAVSERYRNASDEGCLHDFIVTNWCTIHGEQVEKEVKMESAEEREKEWQRMMEEYNAQEGGELDPSCMKQALKGLDGEWPNDHEQEVLNKKLGDKLVIEPRTDLPISRNRTRLREFIREAINRDSAENGSNTPDFILASYLISCLDAFDGAIRERSEWYNRWDEPGR